MHMGSAVSAAAPAAPPAQHRGQLPSAAAAARAPARAWARARARRAGGGAGRARGLGLGGGEAGAMGSSAAPGRCCRAGTCCPGRRRLHARPQPPPTPQPPPPSLPGSGEAGAAGGSRCCPPRRGPTCSTPPGASQVSRGLTLLPWPTSYPGDCLLPPRAGARLLNHCASLGRAGLGDPWFGLCEQQLGAAVGGTASARSSPRLL